MLPTTCKNWAITKISARIVSWGLLARKLTYSFFSISEYSYIEYKEKEI